ncbi:hypothetical protein [Sphingomonas astaxanthinifaciens]|uniref:Uncharacterized protein n=1 Tax=Sphingomonas astaxanthinifaciens DSM 22298 TaxID=1123267 RepID=A0ABQ5Z246_9SPHN|nr:hypothetical protein [Sphingomonas astaxanthinifaciens]GLR46828.1 hypothetical protein GCM10007925_05390 [Sphingomonas astaxanthinifaciens DSM 22298]
MDAFAYLSVLLSIILGLAVQQVLQGYRALILSRGRVRFYWVPILWSVLILLMVAQHWWASFGLARHDDWTFPDFLVTLVTSGLIYMSAAIVLPDVPPDAELDLDSHYWRERRALFGLFTVTVASSILREWQLEGRLPLPENFAFHGVFILFGLTGLVTARRRVHEAMALGMAAVITIYVVALFMRLGS